MHGIHSLFALHCPSYFVRLSVHFLEADARRVLHQLHGVFVCFEECCAQTRMFCSACLPYRQDDLSNMHVERANDVAHVCVFSVDGLRCIYWQWMPCTNMFWSAFFFVTPGFLVQVAMHVERKQTMWDILVCFLSMSSVAYVGNMCMYLSR